MRKASVWIAGLAFIGVGIWFIATEHTRTAACDATSGGALPHASNACQTVAWMYFLGFVLAGVGVLLLMSSTFVRRRDRRYARTDPRSDVSIRMSAPSVGAPPRLVLRSPEDEPTPKVRKSLLR